PGPRAPLLGGGRIDGPDAGIVRFRFVELGGGVRGRTDPEPEAPGSRNREIVLADVDVVGVDEQSEVRAVVDDERNSEPPGQLADIFQYAEQLTVGKRFLTNLDDVHAAADGSLDQLGEPLAGRGDQVEAAIHLR